MTETYTFKTICKNCRERVEFVIEKGKTKREFFIVQENNTCPVCSCEAV